MMKNEKKKNEENRNNPFWNAKLSIEERLDWLLANLTLEEKIMCMVSTVPALPRFGIDKSYVGGEAAHGVEARNDQNGRSIPEPTTSFPQPIGMSASWDTELIKKAGEVTGTEARVPWHRHPVGGLSRWAPTVDLERDPRWGRNEEGYGEDPVLTGAMAGAYNRRCPIQCQSWRKPRGKHWNLVEEGNYSIFVGPSSTNTPLDVTSLQTNLFRYYSAI